MSPYAISLHANSRILSDVYCIMSNKSRRSRRGELSGLEILPCGWNQTGSNPAALGTGVNMSDGCKAEEFADFADAITMLNWIAAVSR